MQSRASISEFNKDMQNKGIWGTLDNAEAEISHPVNTLWMQTTGNSWQGDF